MTSELTSWMDQEQFDAFRKARVAVAIVDTYLDYGVFCICVRSRVIKNMQPVLCTICHESLREYDGEPVKELVFDNHPAEPPRGPAARRVM